VIYLDSSALVKLVRAEDCSEALQSWIDQRAEELLVTSHRCSTVRALAGHRPVLSQCVEQLGGLLAVP
jgi:hypothetical protein